MKHLQPHSLTGVDFAGKAIAFCRRQHQQPGLSFRRGDAEKLPFSDDSFDGVLNVESSPCYPSMERFLAEVVGVLRPGGHLLFADLRPQSCVELLRRQRNTSGLTVLEEEQIAPNVLRALDLDCERRAALVEKGVPRWFRKAFRDFAVIRDTPVYESFRTGH